MINHKGEELYMKLYSKLFSLCLHLSFMKLRYEEALKTVKILRIHWCTAEFSKEAKILIVHLPIFHAGIM